MLTASNQFVGNRIFYRIPDRYVTRLVMDSNRQLNLIRYDSKPLVARLICTRKFHVIDDLNNFFHIFDIMTCTELTHCTFKTGYEMN